ncbi:hypothetical protein NNO95_05760 [Acinetobacter baumannii]|uniref:hypothetical protein n=1 Tax=Acinetobacter TaxID=469 RepID=UPI00067BF3D7|nr:MULTISPECIES: hypothetical protein [Acinetobacter]MCQ1053872.1 hypothetical protein [Acinetobacter baumannii]MCT6832767.1 hypothetical protein [Acinetobacter baumannii]MCT6910217.1 hypothetical protein [Acinetobacter baumannii]MCT6936376.1 hypothetical protein [Acinetobacter baumannii]MCZ2978982.1 hypothetical protein [Acinetobacter baumannii]
MSEFKAINLLEEFHDYETASQVLNELEEGESIMTRHGLVSREVVAEAALNYRRENKIYEQGDKVVTINKRRSGKLWTWAHITNWRPNHSLLDCGENSLYPFANDEFRHATPEEIAAGHRIDNDMGDDFPIENHISSHCQSKDV